jgi:1,4-alpha-glucan branching enzyme
MNAGNKKRANKTALNYAMLVCPYYNMIWMEMECARAKTMQNGLRRMEWNQIDR